MKRIEGGITAPKGFQAAGVYVGIKNKKKDMAMIYSLSPCVVAGTFTSNMVKAAPVLWNQKIINMQVFINAIVINSGIANACTGKVGEENNYLMAYTAAKKLDVPTDTVLVASTGVIGQQLQMDIVSAGIKKLTLLLDSGLETDLDAAEAIMTTDTKPKYIAYEFELSGGKKARIAGMCKGSGMVHPNMATMLGFITTDVKISREMLNKALKDDVRDTFNMISVDGDTSTNDMVLMIANGEADNEQIQTEDDDYSKFVDALNVVNTFLSKSIAADGEGATKLLECKVIHGRSVRQAKNISKGIIQSSLVKTAVFGNDANWGRVLCAMGNAGVELDQNKVDIYFESAKGKLQLVEAGVSTDYSEEQAADIMDAESLTIIADLNEGEAGAVAWGCDLTHEYVNINADYRS